jgi:ElaB/YqjD/DUF883 family membrane-anchored ribosome-binding protein
MTNQGFDSPTPTTTAPPPTASAATAAPPGESSGVGEQVQQGFEQAKDVVGQAGEQLAEKAQELGTQAQQKLREQVDTRSTEVGEQVTATASAVRDAGRQLRDQGQDLPAQLIEQAAGKAEQLGDYLRTATPERLLHDVEDLGRRQPWAVIAGGVALGFLGARFLKASSRGRYEQRYSNPSASTGSAGPVAQSGAAPWETNLNGSAQPVRRDTPGASPATAGAAPGGGGMPGGFGGV